MLVAALVGIVGMTAAIGVVMITSGSATAGNWKEQLAICANSDRNLRVGCFEEVFYSAYDSKDVEAFNVDLERIERDYPESSMDCHTGGHQAGRRAASSGDYIRAVLGGVSKKNICGNGFIHGAFDEVGHKKASAATYLQLAKICDKVPEEVRIAGCVDGYGHSTWLNTRNLEKALDLCVLFDDSTSQKVCLSGIMMQMYRDDPFTGAPPVMTIDKADEICGRVLLKTGDIEMEKTCYYEAAWPIGLEAGSVAENMLIGRPTNVESWMPPKELIENTRRVYLVALNKCAQFPSWAEICREKIARSPIWRVSGDTKINAAICSVFPPKYATLCVNEERIGKVANRQDDVNQKQPETVKQPLDDTSP